MSTELVARRTQYSSCDDCRKSRVACDGTRNGSSCSRCVNRQRLCTFQWVKDAKPRAKRTVPLKKTTRSRAASTRSEATTTSSVDAHFADALARNGLLSPPDAGPLSIPSLCTSDLTSSTEAQWLSVIYKESWEAIFGSWMGKYSCPFTFV